VWCPKETVPVTLRNANATASTFMAGREWRSCRPRSTRSSAQDRLGSGATTGGHQDVERAEDRLHILDLLLLSHSPAPLLPPSLRVRLRHSTVARDILSTAAGVLGCISHNRAILLELTVNENPCQVCVDLEVSNRQLSNESAAR
jgi:hypothetical protein